MGAMGIRLNLLSQNHSTTKNLRYDGRKNHAKKKEPWRNISRKWIFSAL